MLFKIKDKTINLPLNQSYAIHYKNGEYEIVRVVGLVNTQLGTPFIKVRHPHGWFRYIKMSDVKDLRTS